MRSAFLVPLRHPVVVPLWFSSNWRFRPPMSSPQLLPRPFSCVFPVDRHLVPSSEHLTAYILQSLIDRTLFSFSCLAAGLSYDQVVVPNSRVVRTR